ncbi:MULTISPECIES: methyltransferase domain-containing protein [unclassified Aeromonas]|uniref:methyltransferase domain-containing protein n=1 Tax=unclassified Aeromonas TaxID=257493 RepID=UPI0022E741C4|nr:MULTISPECIES: methyltransferase domain-containing protein [unclassified Aeromonas]
MMHQEKSITTLVKQLPEVYQPIFKHPEFTAQASRSCLDRLETIASTYDYISKEKGKPLKVLDLGCAQGFFSLSLAERGAIVTAVDYSQPNIDVCKKLAEENSSFNVEFLLGSIETIVQERVKEQEYDLVLGLSVFHHLVYEHGAEYVFDLLKILSNKVETGIFEFALNTEPLYWAASQPEDPRQLIESYIFSHHVSMYGTHLSAVERPLFFASNKYWNLNEFFGVIDHVKYSSHQLDTTYHDNKRRYYFSGDKIIKIFLKNSTNSNYSELLNESVFLKENIPRFHAPKLFLHGSNNGESWLARTLIPGRLLLDIILAGDEYDDEKVISSLLEQVTALEEHGLYHNDLRPWNILIGNDSQTYIIDYGSIESSSRDGDDLYGQILSFFVLLKEISQHKIREQGSQRPRFISPHDFPEKYQKWIAKVWMIPSQQWSFKSISIAYYEQDGIIGDVPVSAIFESYLSITTNHINWNVKQLQDVVANRIDTLADDICVQNKNLLSELNKKEDIYFKLIKQLSEKLDRAVDIASERHTQSLFERDTNSKVLAEAKAHFVTELDVQKKISDNLRNELDLVYGSNSWKVTYPLRLVSKSINFFFQPRKLLSTIKSVAKKKIKGLAFIVNMFFSNRPLLKQRVVRWLNRYPELKYRLKRNLPRGYNNAPTLSTFTNIALPENPYGKAEKESPCAVKKIGMHEKQKSVLESWLY